ncbi:MAG: hypothetical protein QME60_07235 [Verrucomicrobiota bacterium]|nr:hypothetical protein [Verrucomicrobiota bacterium]
MSINWNSILLRYLIIGAAGSLAIVAGTYFIHAHDIDLAVGKEALVRQGIAGLAVLQDVAAELSGTNNVSRLKDVAIRQTRADAAATAAPATTSPGPAATQNIAKPQPGYWAVVRGADTPTYNRTGKFLRALSPGTPVDILDIQNTKAGQVAVCKVLYTGIEVNDVVILAKDLDIRPGSLGSADPKEKNLRILYAQILGQIKEREAELAEGASQKNPHYAEYRRIQQEYLAFAHRAEELTRKRDEATGALKMEYVDQLRAMKGEDIRLGQAYKAAKQKRQEWNRQNAASASAGSSSGDPQISALRIKLSDIENELRLFN